LREFLKNGKESLQGTWLLHLMDDQKADVGYFDDLYIELTPPKPDPGTLPFDPVVAHMSFIHKIRDSPLYGVLNEYVIEDLDVPPAVSTPPRYYGAVGVHEDPGKQFNVNNLYYYVDITHDLEAQPRDFFTFDLGIECWKKDFLVVAIVDLVPAPIAPVIVMSLGADPYHQIDLTWFAQEHVYIHMFRMSPEGAWSLDSVSGDMDFPDLPTADRFKSWFGLQSCSIYGSKAYALECKDEKYPVAERCKSLQKLRSVDSNIMILKTACEGTGKKEGDICEDHADCMDSKLFSVGRQWATGMTCTACQNERVDSLPAEYAPASARGLRERRALAAKRVHGKKRGLLFAPIPTTTTTSTTTGPYICRCEEPIAQAVCPLDWFETFNMRPVNGGGVEGACAVHAAQMAAAAAASAVEVTVA